jgi:uncharacterized protein DUF2505
MSPPSSRLRRQKDINACWVTKDRICDTVAPMRRFGSRVNYAVAVRESRVFQPVGVPVSRIVEELIRAERTAGCLPAGQETLPVQEWNLPSRRLRELGGLDECAQHRRGVRRERARHRIRLRCFYFDVAGGDSSGRSRGTPRYRRRRGSRLGLGTVLLAPAQNGSRLKCTTTGEFKFPLVGGKIESYIGRRMGQQISEIQRFTTKWITERCPDGGYAKGARAFLSSAANVSSSCNGE